MAAKVTQFLNENIDTPFYLHIGSTHPHRAGKGFGNDQTPAGIQPGSYTPDEIIVPNFLPDVPAVREDLADYYESVSRCDAVVGAVLDALDASGSRRRETLVFVTTDHAMPFPGAKASSFDSGHHCPLLISSPTQQKRGFHNQALVNWVDFCPTMLDWCWSLRTPTEMTHFQADQSSQSLKMTARIRATVHGRNTYFSHCFHEVTNYYPYRGVTR